MQINKGRQLVLTYCLHRQTHTQTHRHKQTHTQTEHSDDPQTCLKPQMTPFEWIHLSPGSHGTIAGALWDTGTISS